jgi:S-disulfanyl-L-cysteine oxidoreductase SoxD
MATFRTRCSAEISIVLSLAILTTVTVIAQRRVYPEIGRTPTADEIKKWDIAIGPAGKELPPGSGNVMQGTFFYITKHCIVCHGAALEGTQYGPRLAGGSGTLATPAPVRTVGSYWPFATTVWDYINRAMPRSPYQEGSLSPNEVYSLTALILYKNDIIKADQIVDAMTLPAIRMPNRDGFVPAHPDWGAYEWEKGKGKR